MLLKFTAYFSKTILRKLFKYYEWTLFAKNWKRILTMTIFLLGETTKREISLLKCISRLHFILDQDQLLEMYYSSHYWFFSISTIYSPTYLSKLWPSYATANAYSEPCRRCLTAFWNASVQCLIFAHFKKFEISKW